ncbi:hypothetical protein CANMA_000612 [Candida margitis]|uniref:uncharacterized protein n=1 Tax=Candida margitis TaxID=1775924 RepID=UPI0022277C85|nr:uncharacterized protein CANMA_000612 [Candida margitis]KAI5970260.1 hypothetical protein CANMA_000612 [Candida margitis]
MLAADTPFSKRLTQCTCAVVWCLLCGGPIFGFAALKPILIKEHVYESLCDLHPETTTSLVRSAASEVVAKCTSFPERSGTILAMLTGAFDASSACRLYELDSYPADERPHIAKENLLELKDLGMPVSARF